MQIIETDLLEVRKEKLKVCKYNKQTEVKVLAVVCMQVW